MLFKRQDKQALLEAHVNCFDFWGHVPSLMVYDNMRTAVKSFVGEKKPTAEICQLQAFYGFQHVFCNIRSGNEKGHVERSVDVVRRDAFAFRDTFDTLEEANAYLLSVCQKNNEERQEQIQVPKSVKNSLALKQTSDELQQVFRTHFEDNPRDFINLLIWARNNKISHEDLCSVVLVAESQGRRTITSEVIQKLIAGA